MTRTRWLLGLCSLVLGLGVAACGGAAAPSSPPPPATQAAATPAPEGTHPAPAPSPSPAGAASEGTAAPQPTTVPATLAPAPSPSATPLTEDRYTELEWPARLRLGDSDLIRLSLIPRAGRYEVITEYPDHTTVTGTVPVPRPGGYDLSAVARLDATGFDYSPSDEVALGLPLNTPVTWRWTITPRSAGLHRLSVSLRLRWTPHPGNLQPLQEIQVYSRGLEIRVTSFLGLTTAQAAGIGLVGMLLGGTLSLPLAAYLFRPRRLVVRTESPNSSLVIEPNPAFSLRPEETTLLQTLFRKYARLVVEAEFRSGYSGARTVLARPLHANGRADAATIAKMGEQETMLREYANYERFVKDTLPPMTARIQEAPVTTAARPGGVRLAALRYTFISEPGLTPTSLREALLADPDPALLEKLFTTFGPNWWMQRHPYTFRLAQEYDTLLPAHLVLEPGSGRARQVLDGRCGPTAHALAVGDWVTVRHFPTIEHRGDGISLSLTGHALPGLPPLRVRWLSTLPPEGRTARVTATRDTLLQDYTRGFDRLGLPDPLLILPRLLAESISGTQSVIHGDLNLENILVGPGGFVWLIDFAQTRDGHPLADFAHLAASLIAQILAPRRLDPPEFLAALGTDPLLAALRAIAGRCLFNPTQFREYEAAVFLACLGALKYTNLSAAQKYRLYLTAAQLAQTL